MFPTLKLFGVGSIPWSPLARGLLTRSLEKQKASKRGEIDNWMPMYNMAGEWFETIVNRVEELATKKEISMAQIALAWIMNRDESIRSTGCDPRQIDCGGDGVLGGAIQAAGHYRALLEA